VEKRQVFDFSVKSFRFGKSKCSVLKSSSQSWKKTFSSVVMEDRSKSLAEVKQCVASTVGLCDESFNTFKKVEVKWKTLTISWLSKSELVSQFLDSLTRSSSYQC
jgi:hypothetical protein